MSIRMMGDIAAEVRALEREYERRELLEVTPRNSVTSDSEDGATAPAPMLPILQSVLAQGAEREVELMEKPIVLTSDLACQILISSLSPLNLVSPLGKAMAAAVEASPPNQRAGPPIKRGRWGVLPPPPPARALYYY